jgi:excisionase family DNA binding protein
MNDTITTQEAAPLLGVHRATVVRWCKAGKIAGAYLPGRSRKLGYRLPRASILALLEPAELDALEGRASG